MDFNPLTQDTTSSRTTATLLLLAEIGEAINANLSLDTVLTRIVTALVRLIPCDVMTIALMDSGQDSFQLFAVVDGQGIPLELRIGQHIAVSEFPTVQKILQTRTWLYVPDVNQSTLWRKLTSGAARVQAFLGAPLIM